MSGITLGGAHLTGFAGIGGPYRYGLDLNHDGVLDNINASAVGLVLDDVNFGLAVMLPTLFVGFPALAALTPKFLSAKASIKTAGLVGIPKELLSAEVHDIEVNINTFGTTDVGFSTALQVLQVSGPPYIDFKKSKAFKDFTEDTNGNGVLDLGEDLNGNLRLDSGEDTNKDGILQLSEDRNQNGIIDTAGFDLPAGGNNMVFLDFTSELTQAKVGYAQMNLAGFLQMSGSMAFTKPTSVQLV